MAKIADFVVPSDPKTSFCVSNFHGGNDAGVHAIAPKATIKFNFRSNSQEELAKLRTNIFNAIEEACQEETAKWGQDTITWDKKLTAVFPADPGYERSPGGDRLSGFKPSGRRAGGSTERAAPTPTWPLPRDFRRSVWAVPMPRMKIPRIS